MGAYQRRFMTCRGFEQAGWAGGMLGCVRELLCPVVVGRDQELVEVRRALDRVVGGHGTALVVAGEAGVGKSRLVREAAGDAVRRGAVVLTGRAVERGSPLAFRPIAEALFSHFRRSGPPRVPELAPFRDRKSVV